MGRSVKLKCSHQGEKGSIYEGCVNPLDPFTKYTYIKLP